jgi:bifunctional DNA-binding transcriptional regulator/antitoxin component of YhaV-PrlF toxin-antitoxin module
MGARARTTRGVTRTGIIRHIDELGRIVIPIEIRKRFGLC